eukprot:COSAG02_NODE_968_length_15583_cov_13.420369_3_plen_152_part_00
MYAGGMGGRSGVAERRSASQVAAAELTGLAAAASHAAATEAHSLDQLNTMAQHHLAQQHQTHMGYQHAAMQLDRRTKDLIHAHMPMPPSLMGATAANPEVKDELPQAKKRRQSQARLTQNAEAQKRYRYARHLRAGHARRRSCDTSTCARY